MTKSRSQNPEERKEEEICESGLSLIFWLLTPDSWLLNSVLYLLRVGVLRGARVKYFL
jgi:hypothetical protein